MQITSNEISNTKYMQIYLTKDELEKQETKKEIIENIKKKKYHISILYLEKRIIPKFLKKLL